MNKYRIFISLFSVCLCMMCSLSYAEVNKYEHYKGWFFHNEEYEEEPEPEKKLPVPTQKQAEKKSSEKASKPLTATQQMEVFVKSFKEAQNRATLDPTDENMRAWLYQQRAMWNQADRFSKKFKEFVFSDSILGSARDYPTSSYAIDAFAREREMKIMNVVRLLSKKGQLFFFFDSTCPHSQAQVSPLKHLKKKYGVEYFAISVDGEKMKGIEEYKVDNGIAKNYGVKDVPALYFVIPKTKELFFISEGTISTDNMVERLVVVAKRGNFVPKDMIPKEFNTDKKDGINDVNYYIRRAINEEL